MFIYILNRLREPSTWRGLCYLVTALGISLNPEQQNAIIAAGLAVAGAIGVLFPDIKNPLKP